MKIRQIRFGYVSLGVLCLAIGAILGGNGCNRQELEQRFVYTMKDGSHGVIIIEYKPNSLMKENKKLGSYYYIVEYFPSNKAIARGDQETLSQATSSPKENGRHREAQMTNKTTKNIDELEKAYQEIVVEPWMREKLNHGVVKIAFYDKNGHSLLRNGYRTRLTPAVFVEHTYEANLIEDGCEWKGHFDETWLTFENFCDIASVKVEYIR